jgi:VIT1/CCC1 family predicted Fe2+/Mn2+ transporter
MNCPQCQSGNTQKFKIAHESGTDDVEGIQTKLAKKCEPPNQPFLDGFFAFVAVILSAFVAIVVGFNFHSFWWGVAALVIAFIALSIFWSSTIGAVTGKRYDAKLAEWEKSWICMKCGHAFKE